MRVPRARGYFSTIVSRTSDSLHDLWIRLPPPPSSNGSSWFFSPRFDALAAFPFVRATRGTSDNHLREWLIACLSALSSRTQRAFLLSFVIDDRRAEIESVSTTDLSLPPPPPVKRCLTANYVTAMILERVPCPATWEHSSIHLRLINEKRLAVGVLSIRFLCAAIGTNAMQK